MTLNIRAGLKNVRTCSAELGHPHFRPGVTTEIDTFLIYIFSLSRFQSRF